MDALRVAIREVVGRRRTISAAGMAQILRQLAERGLIDLRNPYVHETLMWESERSTDTPLDHLGIQKAAERWAQMCRDITCISVGTNLRDGDVRYDEPGRMNPSQQAALCFVPAGINRNGCDAVGYMRRHADRVLLVRPAPEAVRASEPEPESEPESLQQTVECDNGHRWQTDDPERDWRCPKCGEGWV